MARDVTEYAQSLGYNGARAVVVRDGRVISHANQDWFEFCDRLRKQARLQQRRYMRAQTDS